MNIIIIEGIDRIGKSTLVNFLAERLPNSVKYGAVNKTNLKKIHEVRRRPDFFETRHIGILEQVASEFYTYSAYPQHFGHLSIIFDRLHWTAYTYAKILRPDSLAQIFKFDENMIKYNQLFERDLLTLSNADVYQFTFAVPENSNLNEDDFVKDVTDLVKINREFRNAHEFSVIQNKHLIELEFDNETRRTNLSTKFEEILSLITT